VFVGQDRKRLYFDTFFQQRTHFIKFGIAINRARFNFLVVHLPRKLWKLIANIFGIFCHVLTQCFQQFSCFLLFFRQQCDRLPLIHSFLAAFSIAGLDCRRHDRLGNFSGTANRAIDEAALELPFAFRRILKPAFELVAGFAYECVVNHRALPIRCNRPLSAGDVTSKRRPC